MNELLYYPLVITKKDNMKFIYKCSTELWHLSDKIVKTTSKLYTNRAAQAANAVLDPKTNSSTQKLTHRPSTKKSKRWHLFLWQDALRCLFLRRGLDGYLVRLLDQPLHDGVDVGDTQRGARYHHPRVVNDVVKVKLLREGWGEVEKGMGEESGEW